MRYLELKSFVSAMTTTQREANTHLEHMNNKDPNQQSRIHEIRQVWIVLATFSYSISPYFAVDLG